MTNKNCSSFGHFPNGKLRFLYDLKKNTETLIRKPTENPAAMSNAEINISDNLSDHNPIPG